MNLWIIELVVLEGQRKKVQYSFWTDSNQLMTTSLFIILNNDEVKTRVTTHYKDAYFEQ